MADGAGSAEFSREGSRVAVNTVGEYLKAFMQKQSGESDRLLAQWQVGANDDPETKNAAHQLGNQFSDAFYYWFGKMLENEDKTELIESFYKDLEFGTGGLRGIMGSGSNRMNIYTVGGATQGLSNYLNKNFKELKQISVVVGHDCRNNSRKFAEISADIVSYFVAISLIVYTASLWLLQEIHHLSGIKKWFYPITAAIVLCIPMIFTQVGYAVFVMAIVYALRLIFSKCYLAR